MEGTEIAASQIRVKITDTAEVVEFEIGGRTHWIMIEDLAEIMAKQAFDWTVGACVAENPDEVANAAWEGEGNVTIQ